MSDGCLLLSTQDEQLLLHPGRAVIWPRRKTAIVADTHFGKSSFFGRHGIAVPAGSDDADRAELSRLVKDSRAERLIVLGDFLHVPIGAESREAQDLDEWSRNLAPLHIMVIAGNHDRGAARLWRAIEWREVDMREPPFRFIHEAPDQRESDQAFTLSGHIHPVVRLGTTRKSGLRVPVFWQRPAGLVLPSFGAFTGGFAVRPKRGEHLFAVGSSAVVQVT
jgi:uncharacterized protein